MLVSCLGAQACDRRTKVRRMIVPELNDGGMLLERCLNKSALHTSSPSMHQPHFVKPRSGCGGDVLLYNRRDFARIERMEI